MSRSETIARLTHREGLDPDTDAVAGPGRGGAAIREEIAHRLAALSLAYGTCVIADTAMAARGLRRLGSENGLRDLTRAAQNAVDCCGRTDAAALGATVARLERLGRLTLARLGGE